MFPHVAWQWLVLFVGGCCIFCVITLSGCQVPDSDSSSAPVEQAAPNMSAMPAVAAPNMSAMPAARKALGTAGAPTELAAPEMSGLQNAQTTFDIAGLPSNQSAGDSMPPEAAPIVHVALDATPRWHISPYLSTLSFVYTWAPDAVYNNGTFAAWARSRKVATARYPAGTAAYWDWENPTGRMGESRFDPNYAGPDAPAENWMNMSEYLTLCDKIGISKPLVGVNYNCKTQNWQRLPDSLASAERQVKYVMSRGFPGAFYYIGNEDQAPIYAKRLAKHARAIKAVDPEARTMYNDNDNNPERLKAFLKIAGDSINGAEFHGKWPYGGTPGLPPGTYQEWLREVPLVDRKRNVTWREKIRRLREAAADSGRPDLLLANNEFGLGKSKNLVGFNRFTKSLVNVEFCMEMFIGGYDMAVFWDAHDGSSRNSADQMLMDTFEGHRFNPVHVGFEMLSRAANQTMIPVQTSEPRVHGFAALTDDGTVLVYLLNKLETTARVQIVAPTSVLAARGQAMVDTPDHWGTTAPFAVRCKGTGCDVMLPKVSFTMFTLSFADTEGTGRPRRMTESQFSLPRAASNFILV